MKYLLVMLMLLTGLVHAEVYKYIDDKGAVVYSDQPRPGAERVKLPEIQTYTPPPAPKLTPAPVIQPVQKLYERMAIVEPEKDGTVRNNQGVVQVRVSLTPPLMARQGHKIQFYLDTQPHGIPVTNTAIGFSNLDRGSHTLSASVLDAGGQTVMTADPVTFHLHRESKLFPQRRPTPNPLPAN